MGFEVRTFPQNEPELYKRDMRELMQMLDDGFKPLIGATFPLAQAAEALRFVADRRATGKVIVTND
jgi:NADPH2:quinone reductase